MVRRAERSLGVAIREGQADGTIEGKGTQAVRGNRYVSRKDDVDIISKASPSDFVSSKTELSNPHGTGIYAITDDVTDEEFNNALDQAQTRQCPRQYRDHRGHCGIEIRAGVIPCRA